MPCSAGLQLCTSWSCLGPLEILQQRILFYDSEQKISQKKQII